MNTFCILRSQINILTFYKETSMSNSGDDPLINSVPPENITLSVELPPTKETALRVNRIHELIIEGNWVVIKKVKQINQVFMNRCSYKRNIVTYTSLQHLALTAVELMVIIWFSQNDDSLISLITIGLIGNVSVVVWLILDRHLNFSNTASVLLFVCIFVGIHLSAIWFYYTLDDSSRIITFIWLFAFFISNAGFTLFMCILIGLTLFIEFCVRLMTCNLHLCCYEIHVFDRWESKHTCKEIPVTPGNSLRCASCTACMVTFKEDDKVFSKQCGKTHLYHQKCIETYLTTGASCPAC